MPSGNSSLLKETTVTGNIELSPDVYLISFERRYDFIPGQVLKIGLDSDQPPRIYSICSGNKDPEVSVLFNVKKDGVLTPRLASLIPGDKLLVSEPYGSFMGSNEPAWWIASGTGIAPFYSMFRSGLKKKKTLIHGVSYLNQFYFEDELEEAFENNYIRCCSRESSCNTFKGRVTDYLAQLEHFRDVKYFICGQAIMVVEVRDLLISKGVPFANIEAEIYF
jgi:ferredoxin/flavodoxin---NADP+ reductase